MLGKTNAHSSAGVTGNHGMTVLDCKTEQWKSETRLWREYTGIGQHVHFVLGLPLVCSDEDDRALIEQMFMDDEFVTEDIFNLGMRDGLGKATLDVSREPSIYPVWVEIREDVVVKCLYVREGWRPYKKSVY